MLLRLFASCALLCVAHSNISLAQYQSTEPRSAAQSVDGEWVHDYPLPGVGPEVKALASDGKRLFVGGLFRVAGSEFAYGVAAYSFEDQTWTALANDMNLGGVVETLAIGSDGSLYVGGNFSTIAGIEVNGVARYDFTLDEWFDLDGGVSGTVYALAVGPNGTVYAGGSFSSAGGTSTSGIAAWNGNEWVSIGNVIGVVYSLLWIDGNLYVGGRFSMIDGIAAKSIAIYNEGLGVWDTPGQGLGGPFGATVYAIEASDDYVYVGGFFHNAVQEDGSVVSSQNATRWNRTLETWEAAGIGIHIVVAFGKDGDGGLYAGTIDLLRRVGNAWESIGFGQLPQSALRHPSAILAVESTLAVGFTVEYLLDGTPNPAQTIYSYDPATDAWGVFAAPAIGGVDQVVGAIALDHQGGLYLGGDFAFAGRTPAAGIAYRPPGDSWKSLARGVAGSVHSLMVHEDETIYAGGLFNSVIQADGEPVHSRGVAAWSPKDAEWRGLGGGVGVGGGLPAVVRAITTDFDGSILVGGRFTSVIQADGTGMSAVRIARWRPADEAWEAVPGGHGLVDVFALGVDAAGVLYAGGVAQGSPNVLVGRVTRLHPGATEWETLRDWTASLDAIATDLVVYGNPGSPWGGLYVAVYAEGSWYWNGTDWLSIGGPTYAFRLAMNGRPGEGGVLYVGEERNPEPGSNDPGPWQWDGTEWMRLGEGVARLDDGWSEAARIFALHSVSHHDGTASLWVGGFFGLAGGHPSASLARWVTEDYGVSTEAPPVAVDTPGLSVFPNPVAGASTVEFVLPAPSEVRVEVYDLLGRRVITLLEEDRLAGTHRVQLSTAGLASGTYVVRLTAGSESRAVLMTRVE